MTGSIVDRPPRRRLAMLTGHVRPAVGTSAFQTGILPISGRIPRTVRVLMKDKTPERAGFRNFAGFPPRPAFTTTNRASIHSVVTCARFQTDPGCNDSRQIGSFCLIPTRVEESGASRHSEFVRRPHHSR